VKATIENIGFPGEKARGSFIVGLELVAGISLKVMPVVL
jgi:hypothetical protein